MFANTKFADLFSIILNTDSYKISMHNQYPQGTDYVYSYIESRGGEYDKTIMFGLQAFLREYLSKPITMAQIDFAEKIITNHGYAFPRDKWEYIVREYSGYLPVQIKALNEGTIIDKKNVLVSIVNTDPNCYWLTTYLEPAILRAVWYGTTVASNSYASKRIILDALEKSGTPEDINFKLHDFGTRGVSSFESCVIGGMAHLVNFMGTDNVPALVGAMAYYDAPDVVGFSIPAMEHSTVTAWGRENEVEAYRNMLNQYAKPGAILACVSDAYDIFNCVENLWGEELRQQVIDSGAVVVVRPDSGDAVSVIEKCLRLLDKKFGHTVNAKGYKVLNNVRIIQGDGIDHTTIRSILFSVMLAGYSADNLAFGQGGALLQGIDRDTLKFAMKCSAAQINGEWVDVYKDPITDAGKKSKKGRMVLVKEGDAYRTVTTADAEYDEVELLDALRLVYNNGTLTSPQTFADIRDRANGRV